MSPPLALVVSALLTWAMLLFASLAKARGWTPAGMMIAFGNRDDVPEPTAFAARADRAAKNMLENLGLFVAVLVAAWIARASEDALRLPCAVFVGARLLYAPLYWAGVKFVRTAVWMVSLVGLFWIAGLALAG